MTDTLRTIKVDSLRVIDSNSSDETVLFVAKYFIDGKAHSKAFNSDMILAGATVDLKAQTLTVPMGKRGRRASLGLSQDEIANRIASLQS